MKAEEEEKEKEKQKRAAGRVAFMLFVWVCRTHLARSTLAAARVATAVHGSVIKRQLT